LIPWLWVEQLIAAQYIIENYVFKKRQKGRSGLKTYLKLALL
jgi:hypothetical protein